MNRKTYEKLVHDFVTESLALSSKKAKDYATDDCLSNFKRMTTVARSYKIDFSQPHHYALFMLLMKLDRLQNLTSTGSNPENESLHDTWKDAFNYLMLALASYEEHANKR